MLYKEIVPRVYTSKRKAVRKRAVCPRFSIHKIDRRRLKRERRKLDRLIVNCKQFRNCVDKTIKPFDWLRAAKRSTTNTPDRDDITGQTADDNAIWIIHGACTETIAALVQVSGRGHTSAKHVPTRNQVAWWNSTTAKSRALLYYRCSFPVWNSFVTHGHDSVGIIRVHPAGRILVALWKDNDDREMHGEMVKVTGVHKGVHWCSEVMWEFDGFVCLCF